MGAEVEYAIRVPDEEPRRFDDDTFHAIVDSIRCRLPGRAGHEIRERDNVFFANGCNLSLEWQEGAYRRGLVEGATPECRGPRQLVTALRGLDGILLRALRDMDDDTGLLRNGRDGMGHVYGPQESYQTEFAEGRTLLMWRLALFPLFALLVVVTLFAVLVATIAAVRVVGNNLEAPPHDDELNRQLEESTFPHLRTALHPFFVATLGTVSWLGWRRYRPALGFLSTRMVFSGAGSLRKDGFHLSEKADQITGIFRRGSAQEDRGLLEAGHMVKHLFRAMTRRDLFAGAWKAEQRLQLGMADATMCDLAGWLAFGTTSLVLDLAEAGFLDDAPRLLDPVDAAHRTSSDGPLVTLKTTAGPLSALEVQRWYCSAAKNWLATLDTVNLEASELVQVWNRVLHQLEFDPDALIGEVDWITKRALIEQAGDDLTWEERKTIDLRYHELGGYHADLVEAGVAVRVVSPDALARAMEHPPEDSPAEARAALIRDTPQSTPVVVDWAHARVGGVVIPFPSQSTRRERDPD